MTLAFAHTLDRIFCSRRLVHVLHLAGFLRVSLVPAIQNNGLATLGRSWRSYSAF